MRLSQLSKVCSLSAERLKLANLRAEIEMDQAHIVVRGSYLDDAMTALVRPVLLGEIDARLHRVAADLRTLGVQLDTDAA